MGEGEAASQIDVMGVTLRITVPSDSTAGAYSIVEQIDRPGAGSPPHANSKESIVIAVVEGRVEVALHDGSVSLGPGESVSVPSGTRHWTRNAGEYPSTTLYTFVPGGFEGFFIEAAKLGSTPDLEQVAKLAGSYGMEIAPPEEG
jgi:quercetin dioxygenase-like cupin family protein